MRYLLLIPLAWLMLIGLIGHPAPERTFRGDGHGYRAFDGDLDIEVGDREAERFRPHVRFERWGGLADLAIGLDDIAAGTRQLRDGQVLWRTAEYVAAVYFKPGRELEFEVRLPRRPRTNRWRFNIRSRGLSFLKQPDLRGEKGIHQPARVIGSYAVYYDHAGDYSASGGRNYGTGKVTHIYRPHMEDATGRRTWCELDVVMDTLGTGRLDITCPAAALANSTYPVIVDPTIGYTNAGATSANGVADRFYGCRATTTQAGTASGVSAYLDDDGSGDSVKGVIIEDVSPYQIRHSKVGAATQINSSTASWKTSSFASGPGLNNATTYIPGMVFESSSIDYYFDSDAPAGTAVYDNSNSYLTPQDLDSGLGEQSRYYSFYATYSSASGDPEFPAGIINRAIVMNWFWRVSR